MFSPQKYCFLPISARKDTKKSLLIGADSLLLLSFFSLFIFYSLWEYNAQPYLLFLRTRNEGVKLLQRSWRSSAEKLGNYTRELCRMDASVLTSGLVCVSRTFWQGQGKPPKTRGRIKTNLDPASSLCQSLVR